MYKYMTPLKLKIWLGKIQSVLFNTEDFNQKL